MIPTGMQPKLSGAQTAGRQLLRNTTQSKFTMRLALWCLCFFELALSGCSYRFSNLYAVAPRNIKSIAIEAIYDTSREVLPHEVIWQEIQHAFAADGHLQIAARQNADAILRVHIRSSIVAPTGDSSLAQANKDDPVIEVEKDPPFPNEFRNLPQAAESRELMALTSIMNVQLWHLESRQKIFERNYSLAGSYRVQRDKDESGARLLANTHFLRSEEDMRGMIARATRGIADAIVQDITIQ